VMSRDWFCTGCGFQEADMEDWVEFDSGWQVEFICPRFYFLEDGVQADLLIIQFV